MLNLENTSQMRTHPSRCFVCCGLHSSHSSSLSHRHSELEIHKLSRAGDCLMYSWREIRPYPVQKVKQWAWACIQLTKLLSINNIQFLFQDYLVSFIQDIHSFIYSFISTVKTLHYTGWTMLSGRENLNQTPQASLGLPQSDVGHHRFSKGAVADHRWKSSESLMGPADSRWH